MAKQTFTTGQVLTAAQMTSLQQTAMGGGSATAKTASYVLVAADAGTTVIMNSASATTITVNTALFSAGDSVYIQNIGAGISTITAGTATVNTSATLALAQYEGGQLYFTSTSAAIFIKGAGAAAASGGFTLISTASPSAASTFEFTSIPGTYKKLYLVGSLVPSADGNGQNYLEFNADTSALYKKTAFGSAGAATQTLEASNQMQLVNNMDNVKGFSITQEYHNYTQSNIKIMTQYAVGWQYDASTTAVTTYQNTNFMYGGTSAISSIKFYAVTGTYTGTVSLYGQN